MADLEDRIRSLEDQVRSLEDTVRALETRARRTEEEVIPAVAEIHQDARWLRWGVAALLSNAGLTVTDEEG